MTTKEFALMLNGREYGCEITKAEEAIAKANGYVVVFGYSDDNVELRGAINDEVSAGEVLFLNRELLTSDCDNDYCPYFKKLHENAVSLVSEYEGEGWVFDMPWTHDTFEVREGDGLFGIGAVFSLRDMPNAKNDPMPLSFSAPSAPQPDTETATS